MSAYHRWLRALACVTVAAALMACALAGQAPMEWQFAEAVR